MPTPATAQGKFFGWRVTWGAFVLAIFGWGLGFYGPPVFLGVLHAAHGWSLGLVSAAVTFHYLIGAGLVTQLPALHARFGIAPFTQLGMVALALGTLGWALAAEPWQLFVAAVFSGFGWSATSSATINAIVALWFVRARPAALGVAFNGASVGGIVFSPLWVATIGAMGFPLAAAVIGIVAILTVWIISATLFSRTPEQMGLAPDGDAQGTAPTNVTSADARPLPGALLWRNRAFITLALANALGLAAQVGLATHLFSLLLPALGAQGAGFAMALVTVLAVAARTLTGWLMPLHADRRVVACMGYGVQLVGSLVFIAAGGSHVPLLLTGIVLFGTGFGNALYMPPLVAQVDFVKGDLLRVVALMVAIGQATFALSPAALGLIRELAPPPEGLGAGAAPWVFATAALAQGLAILAMLAGRSRA